MENQIRSTYDCFSSMRRNYHFVTASKVTIVGINEIELLMNALTKYSKAVIESLPHQQRVAVISFKSIIFLKNKYDEVPF